MSTLIRSGNLGSYAICGYLLFLIFASTPDLSTLLLFALGLTAFLSKDGNRPLLHRLDYIALGLFVGAAILATLWSDDPARSARYLVYLGINMFLLLLAASIANKAQIYLVLGCLTLLGLLHLGVVLAWGSLPTGATPEAIIAGQPFVTLLVPNDALIIGLCLPAAAVFLWRNCPNVTPVVIATITYGALALYASYLLQSKISLISVLAALLALAVMWPGAPQSTVSTRRPTWLVMAIVVALLLLLPAVFYLGNQSTTRLGLWSYALNNSSGAEILVGHGPNTYHYDPAVVDVPIEHGQRMIPWVHNLFLESYAEQGLLGLMGILAVAIIPVIRSIRMEDPAMRAFMLASTLTFVLLGLVEITLTRRFYFAYLALLYGLSCSSPMRRQVA